MLCFLETWHPPVDHPVPWLVLPWQELAVIAGFAQKLQLQDVGQTRIRKTTATHRGGTRLSWTRPLKVSKCCRTSCCQWDPPYCVAKLCSHMHQSQPGAVSPASTDLLQIYTHSSMSPTQKVSKNEYIHFLHATFNKKVALRIYFF